jgi:parvulin-like peptidyl-prolyl isomerase
MTDPEFFDPTRTSVRRSMLLLAVGALLGLAIAGYGLFTAKGTRSRGVPTEAIAAVNQRPVLRSDFMTQAQVQFATPYADTSEAQRRKVLDDMINEELMVQRGLEMDLPSYDPDVRSAMVAGVELEVTADVLAQQPTADDLQKYYLAHRDRYSSEGVMRLRDLIVGPGATADATSANAKAAVAELRAGKPLEKVMQRHGLQDSGKFMQGGQVDTGDILQFSVRSKLDDSLFSTAVALAAGQVSEPISDKDGIHILDMIAYRPPVARAFEQAQAQVWTDLKQEAQNKVRAANLSYLRSRADILIAPEFPH